MDESGHNPSSVPLVEDIITSLYLLMLENENIFFAATSYGLAPFPALLMCIGTTALRPLMHSGFDVAACMQYRNLVAIHCANAANGPT